MGLPLSHGKLAMWLFLVTEIMFFTGLIGTYSILRNGQPRPDYDPWPIPEQVHLVEWVGAFNTFVLICSSLTIVLAHAALGRGNVKRATLFIGVTLALGLVFLVVKAFEYTAKFDHEILPGRVFEKLDGPTGAEYQRHVKTQLEHIVKDPEHAAGASPEGAKKVAALFASYEKRSEELRKEKEKIDKKEEARPAEAAKQKDKLDREFKEQTTQDIEALRKEFKDKDKGVLAALDCWALLNQVDTLTPRQLNQRISKKEDLKPVDQVKGEPVTEGLLDKYPDLHLSFAIPWGNMWASCYFTLTGLHAIHVLGGLVIFVIILLMALRGRFGVQHESMVELTGLYWHFVDIVWIFLFPLLYLV
jgi:cytochrome c oxidase subunit 3